MDEERTKIEKVSTFVCRNEIINVDFRFPPTHISPIGKQRAYSSAAEPFYLFSALKLRRENLSTNLPSRRNIMIGMRASVQKNRKMSMA